MLAFYRNGIRELYKYFLYSRYNEAEVLSTILNFTTLQGYGIKISVCATRVEDLMKGTIKPVIRKLSDKVLSVISDLATTNNNVVISLLISFVVVVLLAIAFFILPYMNSLRQEVSLVD